LQVLSSFDDQFKIKIKRSIESNALNVFDIIQEKPQYEFNTVKGSKTVKIAKNLRILTMRDDEFYVDFVNPID